jgi:hypothetical protein
MKYIVPLLTAAIAAGLLARGRAGAEEAAAPGTAQAVQTIELRLSPATEPRPALKYRFLPALGERKPGNAAIFYYRALLLQAGLPQELWKEHSEKSEAWLKAPPDQFPKDEVAKWLAPQANVLGELKEAAFREECNWDMRMQDLRGLETIAFLLPELQACRNLARTLQLQAHSQIMQGQPDEAFQTLRLGYQLAHDAGKSPSLIGTLIGVAISAIMNEELLQLMQHSSANYYWAIASLPEPLVDLQGALQWEMNAPFQIFPFLKDAETTERTPEEWRRLLVECIASLENLESGKQPQPGWQAELAAAAFATTLYPAAKEQLIAGGLSRDRVEAMSVGQVLAIQTSRSVEYAYHQMFKAALLPYDDAIRLMPAVMDKLEQEGYLRPSAAMKGRTGIPIAQLLLPALQGAFHAEGRMARGLAALQAIEAIRMHAAASGKLPASLAEVKVVPIPKDPVTGQAFPYSFDATSATATLELAPVSSLPNQGFPKRYVIKLK